MKKHKYFILASSICCTLSATAQVNQSKLYPLPQQIEDNNQRVVADKVYYIKTDKIKDATSNALLKTVLPVDAKGKGTPIHIKQLENNSGEMTRSGAYILTIGAKEITIEAADSRGLFYALQTLKQVQEKDNRGNILLPVCSITDYPDVAFRGTVEGFYGEPWSHQDRLEQLRFYGALKLNTYIYGPKDDPYHSSPHWRDAYPADQAAQIKELAQEAAKNKVDFVWAIHPGKDIKWNKSDSMAIVKKFDMMYDLGVRSFAVFFDDISGEGTKPEKQAGVLNYIHNEFISKKKDVTPLIMCPTEYNKSWSNPKPGTYLDILGEQLDPSIHIMWTGNRVVDDITLEGLEWVNNRIKRPAYVWWNFPVSDYVRDHLLMGPSYGLDTNAKHAMSGFVSNPMDKAEASKVAIFGAANYAWNVDNYNPDKSWNDACEYIMPEAAEAFKCFNAHNSDPGHNGHRYRRDESTKIKPVVNRFLESYEKGHLSDADGKQIYYTFDEISKAPEIIKSKSTNKRLLEQIDPWLQQFELLGNAGKNTIVLAGNWQGHKLPEVWANFVDINSLLSQMNKLDQTLNQNPYQPGVKTGSLVLTPFVNRVSGRIEKEFINTLKGNKANAMEAAISSTPSVFTNIGQLKHQPTKLSDAKIAIVPLLEVINIQPGSYLGMAWGEDRMADKLTFNLPNKELLTWGEFQASTDGKTWSKLQTEDKNGKGVIENIPTGTKYLRFTNTSSTDQQIYMLDFTIGVKADNNIAPTYYCNDNNLKSFTMLAPYKPLTFDKTETDAKSVALLVSDNKAGATVKAVMPDGEERIIYEGKDQFIQLTDACLQNAKAVKLEITCSEPIKVHEVIWN
ncbi:MAG: beta-N-acetylglucosaminidase domain-containing protein [Tannerellaceae bacterium]